MYCVCKINKSRFSSHVKTKSLPSFVRQEVNWCDEMKIPNFFAIIIHKRMATDVTVHEHANSYSTNRKIQINGHLPFALLHNLFVRKKAFKPQNVRKKNEILSNLMLDWVRFWMVVFENIIQCLRNIAHDFDSFDTKRSFCILHEHS